MTDDAAFKPNQTSANQIDNFPVTTGATQRLAVVPGSIVRIANPTANILNVNFGSITVAATASDMAMIPNAVAMLQVPMEATFLAIFSTIASNITITRGI